MGCLQTLTQPSFHTVPGTALLGAGDKPGDVHVHAATPQPVPPRLQEQRYSLQACRDRAGPCLQWVFQWKEKVDTDSALCIQAQKEREKPEMGHPLRQTKGLPSPLPHVKQQQAEIQAQKINTHPAVTDRCVPSSARKVPNCFWQVCVLAGGGGRTGGQKEHRAL